MEIEFFLPIKAPSLNRYWDIKRKKPKISKDAAEFKNFVWLYLRSFQKKNKFPKGMKVAVHIALHNHGGDLDNRAKAVLDAIKGVVFDDDKDIIYLKISRGEGSTVGVQVRVWEATDSFLDAVLENMYQKKSLLFVDYGVPPSSNRYWGYGKHGKIYLKQEIREFKKKVRSGIRKTERGESRSVGLVLFCKSKCNGGDLDNKLKAVLDALEGKFYEDDSAVFEIEALKLIGTKERDRFAIFGN